MMAMIELFTTFVSSTAENLKANILKRMRGNIVKPTLGCTISCGSIYEGIASYYTELYTYLYVPASL